MKKLAVVWISVALISSAHGGQSVCTQTAPALPEFSPERSLVHIYKDKLHTAWEGTGTLIDLKRKWILTAGHVVTGDEADFVVPGVNSQQPFTAKVVKRWPSSGDEDSGAQWGSARDIALLEAKTLPDGMAQAELGMSIGENGQGTYFGFPNGMDSYSPIRSQGYGRPPALLPQGDSGAVARVNTDCTRMSESITLPGQSGSPIVRVEGDGQSNYFRGEVIGLVIDEAYANKAAIFVPMTCISDDLISLLPDDEAQTVIKKIATAPGRDLDHWLGTYPQEGPSNLAIMAAFDALEDKPGQLSQDASQNLVCPALMDSLSRGAIPERALFAWLSSRPKDAKLAGDSVINQAQLAAKQGNAERAKTLAEASTVFLKGASLSVSQNASFMQNASTSEKIKAAAFLKDYADAAIFASISGGKSDLASAAVAAAQAAQIAPNKREQGPALAAAAQATSMINNDPAVTKQLYDLAKEKGFHPNWVAYSASQVSTAASQGSDTSTVPLSAQQKEVFRSLGLHLGD